jgi:formamidopyrimidine-DNA glycosylase
MPELPDLEVIRERLTDRVVDLQIVSAALLRPIIVRDLMGGDPVDELTGRWITTISRRGKFLLLGLDDGATIVINPMLAGRIRHAAPLARDRKRDALALGLSDGTELRYNDTADMGKIYLTRDLAAVPTFAELGPDAIDPVFDLDAFTQRVRRHSGEIKGMLTNQSFAAGIGNAYADEICWHARLYPFRRRPTLDQAELRQLFDAMGAVLANAIDTLRQRVPDTLDVEIRDFLVVHGKRGQPCPRCGSLISEVTRERRATHFCRACQPGLLVAR